ncbi:ADP-ribosylation factor-like protein 13B [Sitophilus oryzae]|uniref:ADP-ribosylation factor-like protein 13B n=1 Tax=Sitophilus oryzae TaxID=7048 RepID=A0A6J2XJ36_SITOR|nr:ADP-ribosylation factor-like protein 13B [Sitophilus oryzae]
MGNCCCKDRKSRRDKISLLLVGLDNAGKTVTAKGLAGEAPIHSPVPTVGFSVINLKYLHYDVRVFDLGGGPGIRGIWHKYFVDAHGIIYVVDSCDAERFSEVKDTLEELLCHPKVSGKPLLIFANKQDRECALDEIDIIECLQIESLANKYRCPTLVQSCSASVTNINKLDEGIKTGYDWIMSYIDKNFKELNIRVKMDVIEQELQDKEEIIAKIQRIRAERQANTLVQDPDVIQTYSEYEKMNSKMNGGVCNDVLVLDACSDTDEDVSSELSDSSLTFPAIYHLADQGIERERPKSAVQLVKHQLQMNSELRRSQSAKTRRNKTAPINIFQGREFVPSSAKESVNRSVILAKPPSRNLHSADGRIFCISNRMGPSGDYYDTSREVFTIEDNFKVQKMTAQENKRENLVRQLSIVDIE